MLMPEQIDRWSRNERLYRHLLGLGLVVFPAFADDDRTLVDHLIVSVDLPTRHQAVAGGEETAATAVALPVEGAKVPDVIGPAIAGGDGVVVEFPPVFR